jgi:ATP-dependent DNA helicase RecQ
MLPQESRLTYNAQRALELLRLGSGWPKAQFREDQEEAIRHVVDGRGRLLVVQKTGWGKSFVYFVATKLLRESGLGPALLISPLLALMRNQIAAAERMGVRAWSINSANPDDWPAVESALHQDKVDLLMISPERLANHRFQVEVLARVADRVPLLVIDEAHCISDWGHDFRPHYRLIERMLHNLPPNVRLLATTATANNRVMDDLESVLGPRLTVLRGDLNRPSLQLQTIRMPQQAERLAWLAERLHTLPGSGVVYTLTVRDAEQVAAWLRSSGYEVEPYHSEQEAARREELEHALLANGVKALVATTALGMGYDKPDIGFVIHYQAPGSAVAYYQQVGRAGRALDAAYGVLLSGREEQEITEYFIESAFPTRTEIEQVLQALRRTAQGLSVPELEAQVNLSRSRIEKAFDLLSLEVPAPIVHQDRKWVLTPARLSETFWQRAERLTALRRLEQRQMQDYVNLTSGHMEFLIRALDGEPGPPRRPILPMLPTDVDPALVRRAVEFLRRTDIPIEPRKVWPTCGLPAFGLKGRIPPELQAQPGKALCLWGDAGWGDLVRRGKYEDGRFSDDLVGACSALVREWSPPPTFAWMTCIPSLRHPGLVPGFASRLAAALDLPFVPVLERTCDRPEQKTRANSAQQARNVDGALAVGRRSLPPGPVLLVDDMVDSRWTFTVASWLLRSCGSGDVYPLALALTGTGK